jgi:hypothetical protein
MEVVGGNNPRCTECGGRLTEVLIVPETRTAGSPVKFEFCMRCAPEVFDALGLHGRGTRTLKLH